MINSEEKIRAPFDSCCCPHLILDKVSRRRPSFQTSTKNAFRVANICISGQEVLEIVLLSMLELVFLDKIDFFSVTSMTFPSFAGKMQQMPLGTSLAYI